MKTIRGAKTIENRQRSFNNMSSNNDSENKNKTSDFLVGDIFYTHIDSKYNLYKLLVIDTDFECYHILSYFPLNNLPLITYIDKFAIFVYHCPFDKKVFKNATFLANKPITANDLIGYHEYLRQTQDPSYYTSIALNYYKSGLMLTDENKHHEAIDSYSKAIDLFPQFFEAIDNRALCKMDLGLWTDAIEDFKLSLQQNQNSLLAEFSIGKCYLKMGEYENAKIQFETAHTIDPNHPAPRKFLDMINEILNN